MSLIRHSFYAEDAILYGVDCAVIIEKIGFYIAENLIAGRNIRDGRVWTYNSIDNWIRDKYFPYFTAKQLRTRMAKLINAGVFMTGNYNKNSNDQTRWYAFVDQKKYLSRVILTKESLPDGHKDKVLLSLEDLAQPEECADAHDVCAQTDTPDAEDTGKEECAPEDLANTHFPIWENGNSQMGKSNLPDGEMQMPKRENANAQTGNSLQLTTQPATHLDNPADNLIKRISALSDDEWTNLKKFDRDPLIREWFAGEFWPLYSKRMSSRDKIRAEKKILALSPDCNLRARIISAVEQEADARAAAAEAGQFYPAPKYCATWVHNQCWNEPLSIEHAWYVDDPAVIGLGYKPDQPELFGFEPTPDAVAGIVANGIPEEFIWHHTGEFAIYVTEKASQRRIVSRAANWLFWIYLSRMYNRMKNKGLV